MKCWHCGTLANSDACRSCRRPVPSLEQLSRLASRYELHEYLGRGGMGEVYRAVDLRDGTVMAVKTVLPARATPEYVERLRREAVMARMVTHQNVCRIHDYETEGELNFITMEFVPGTTLKACLEQGALPFKEALAAVRGIARGLAVIHRRGIVHRDLKTSNVMRDLDGVVRVMDFGLARIYSRDQPPLTETNAILGSVHYMSPEQIRGEALDARSDIYALGVIAFELFTGVLPFTAETPVAVMQQHLTGALPLDERVPRSVRPVLERTLAKPREKRYASSAELLRALDHVRADGETTTVVVPTPLRRPPRKTEAEPFGNPDGSRADLDDVLEGFVAFGERAVWGGLASRPEDLSARVIVGRKGSGKTVYLRRLHAHVASDASLFSDDIHQRPPSTDTVVKFCQMIPAATLVTNWTDVWHKALLVSLASYLQRPPLLATLSSECARALERDFARLLPKLGAPVSAYSQATQIITLHGSLNALGRYLADPRWDALEHTLAQALHGCPPLCFFYDAVDEEFERAPMYWLPCQQGLFYAVMNLLRDARFGGRLHVFVSLRDLVLAAVLQSEHRGRYESEPHIRTLNWNRKAISYLLAAKLQRLDRDHLLLDGEPSLRTWLGQDSIVNKARGLSEPIEQYLLRHTRLLPRDLVLLGNDLCAAIARQRVGAPDATCFDDTIRAVVARRARKFGDEQLAVCANHVSSNMIPAGAARLDYAHVYTADKAYVKGIADELKRLIDGVGRERFSHEELRAAQAMALDAFGEQSHVFSVLWQNGLLGYMERQRDGSEARVFYSEELMDYFALPERREYVFHPCLIDAVGIKSIGQSVL